MAAGESGSDSGEDARGVYGITVAAELVGTGVQNLRLYERRGLLTPGRTAGGTRLYSRDDVTRLGRITALLEAGLNLAGVAMVLDLQDDLADARRAADDPAPTQG
ncbi:MerR family transcriptional regulator [Microlunatus capsulatus]|uniref:DNA-binding transcriptional MerR regulator n=1 Tax=Microlunatus capsulatus TaxID=99117 RepID=A0ABS4ZCL0_9ACTN|nr:MerR family transcriptional regulator [Microlunatus capsulatus]MBP2418772.1 DNA-binding transcriptional MerR regulator [Microlunatus capsulatus]